MANPILMRWKSQQRRAPYSVKRCLRSHSRLFTRLLMSALRVPWHLSKVPRTDMETKERLLDRPLSPVATAADVASTAPSPPKRTSLPDQLQPLILGQHL